MRNNSRKGLTTNIHSNWAFQDNPGKIGSSCSQANNGCGDHLRSQMIREMSIEISYVKSSQQTEAEAFSTRKKWWFVNMRQRHKDCFDLGLNWRFEREDRITEFLGRGHVTKSPIWAHHNFGTIYLQSLWTRLEKACYTGVVILRWSRLH